MKPTKKTKRTKGRVMYAGPNHATDKISCLHHEKFVDEWSDCVFPVAVIPCATAKEAKAVVKLLTMIDARAVLQALGLAKR